MTQRFQNFITLLMRGTAAVLALALASPSPVLAMRQLEQAEQGSRALDQALRAAGAPTAGLEALDEALRPDRPLHEQSLRALLECLQGRAPRPPGLTEAAPNLFGRVLGLLGNEPYDKLAGAVLIAAVRYQELWPALQAECWRFEDALRGPLIPGAVDANVWGMASIVMYQFGLAWGWDVFWRGAGPLAVYPLFEFQEGERIRQAILSAIGFQGWAEALQAAPGAPAGITAADYREALEALDELRRAVDGARSENLPPLAQGGPSVGPELEFGDLQAHHEAQLGPWTDLDLFEQSLERYRRLLARARLLVPPDTYLPLHVSVALTPPAVERWFLRSGAHLDDDVFRTSTMPRLISALVQANVPMGRLKEWMEGAVHGDYPAGPCILKSIKGDGLKMVAAAGRSEQTRAHISVAALTEAEIGPRYWRRLAEFLYQLLEHGSEAEAQRHLEAIIALAKPFGNVEHPFPLVGQISSPHTDLATVLEWATYADPKLVVPGQRPPLVYETLRNGFRDDVFAYLADPTPDTLARLTAAGMEEPQKPMDAHVSRALHHIFSTEWTRARNDRWLGRAVRELANLSHQQCAEFVQALIWMPRPIAASEFIGRVFSQRSSEAHIVREHLLLGIGRDPTGDSLLALELLLRSGHVAPGELADIGVRLREERRVLKLDEEAFDDIQSVVEIARIKLEIQAERDAQPWSDPALHHRLGDHYSLLVSRYASTRHEVLVMLAPLQRAYARHHRALAKELRAARGDARHRVVSGRRPHTAATAGSGSRWGVRASQVDMDRAYQRFSPTLLARVERPLPQLWMIYQLISWEVTIRSLFWNTRPPNMAGLRQTEQRLHDIQHEWAQLLNRQQAWYLAGIQPIVPARADAQSPNGPYLQVLTHNQATLARLLQEAPVGEERTMDVPVDPLGAAYWPAATFPASETPLMVELRLTQGGLLVLTPHDNVRAIPDVFLDALRMTNAGFDGSIHAGLEEKNGQAATADSHILHVSDVTDRILKTLTGRGWESIQLKFVDLEVGDERQVSASECFEGSNDGALTTKPLYGKLTDQSQGGQFQHNGYIRLMKADSHVRTITIQKPTSDEVAVAIQTANVVTAPKGGATLEQPKSGLEEPARWEERLEPVLEAMRPHLEPLMAQKRPPTAEEARTARAAILAQQPAYWAIVGQIGADAELGNHLRNGGTALFRIVGHPDGAGPPGIPGWTPATGLRTAWVRIQRALRTHTLHHLTMPEQARWVFASRWAPDETAPPGTRWTTGVVFSATNAIAVELDGDDSILAVGPEYRGRPASVTVTLARDGRIQIGPDAPPEFRAAMETYAERLTPASVRANGAAVATALRPILDAIDAQLAGIPDDRPAGSWSTTVALMMAHMSAIARLAPNLQIDRPRPQRSAPPLPPLVEPAHVIVQQAVRDEMNLWISTITALSAMLADPGDGMTIDDWTAFLDMVKQMRAATARLHQTLDRWQAVPAVEVRFRHRDAAPMLAWNASTDTGARLGACVDAMAWHCDRAAQRPMNDWPAVAVHLREMVRLHTHITHLLEMEQDDQTHSVIDQAQAMVMLRDRCAAVGGGAALLLQHEDRAASHPLWPGARAEMAETLQHLHEQIADMSDPARVTPELMHAAARQVRTRIGVVPLTFLDALPRQAARTAANLGANPAPGVFDAARRELIRDCASIRQHAERVEGVIDPIHSGLMPSLAVTIRHELRQPLVGLTTFSSLAVSQGETMTRETYDTTVQHLRDQARVLAIRLWELEHMSRLRLAHTVNGPAFQLLTGAERVAEGADDVRARLAGWATHAQRRLARQGDQTTVTVLGPAAWTQPAVLAFLQHPDLPATLLQEFVLWVPAGQAGAATGLRARGLRIAETAEGVAGLVAGLHPWALRMYATTEDAATLRPLLTQQNSAFGSMRTDVGTGEVDIVELAEVIFLSRVHAGQVTAAQQAEATWVGVALQRYL